MARTYEPLARRLIKAVDDLTKEPSNEWVPLTRAATVINVTYPELIEGAVSHSRQKGWLEENTVPSRKLRLTHAGRAALARQPWLRPSVA
jgi:hypothetical protein